MGRGVRYGNGADMEGDVGKMKPVDGRAALTLISALVNLFVREKFQC